MPIMVKARKLFRAGFVIGTLALLLCTLPLKTHAAEMTIKEGVSDLRERVAESVQGGLDGSVHTVTSLGERATTALGAGVVAVAEGVASGVDAFGGVILERLHAGGSLLTETVTGVSTVSHDVVGGVVGRVLVGAENVGTVFVARQKSVRTAGENIATSVAHPFVEGEKIASNLAGAINTKTQREIEGFKTLVAEAVEEGKVEAVRKREEGHERTYFETNYLSDFANEIALALREKSKEIKDVAVSSVVEGKRIVSQTTTALSNEALALQTSFLSSTYSASSVAERVWCTAISFFGYDCNESDETMNPIVFVDEEGINEVVPVRVSGNGEVSAPTGVLSHAVRSGDTYNTYPTYVMNTYVSDPALLGNYVTTAFFNTQLDAIFNSMEDGDSAASFDITATSIESLQDVASMTKTAGDLLSWSGTTWSNIATSTLGLTTSTDFDTSVELAAILTDETGTGNLVFSASPTLTGTATLANASTTNLTVASNAYLGTVQSGTWNGTTIGVPYGGTGTTTLTGLLLGNGTAPFTATTTLSASYIEDVYLRNTGDTATGDYTFDTDTFFIDATNNRVGVGTTTPSAKLDIYGTAGSSDIFAISSSTNSRLLTVTAAGNVGIGTTNPLSTFEVAHSGDGTSALRIGDPTTVASKTGLYLRSTTEGRITVGSGAITTFYRGGGTTESMRIDASGNVSIGTSVNNVFDQVGAARALVVQKSDTSTTIGGSTASINIINGDTTTSNTSQLGFGAITGASTNQYLSAAIVAIHGARTNGQYPTGELAFLTSSTLNTAPTEKLRITAAGNVGIGTSAPTQALTIGNGGIEISRTTAPFVLFDYGGTNVAQLRANATNRIAITGPGGSPEHLVVNTTSGNVGIGMTGPSVELDVTGSIEYTGTITDVSDRRLKRDITPLSGNLEKLLTLEPVSFTMKNDASSTPQLGFIAQNVLEVYSEPISYIDPENNDYLGLDYTQLIAPTVGALIELHGELDTLLRYGTTTASSTFSSLFDDNTDTIWHRLVMLAQNFVDGVLRVAGIHTDELCVGNVCVDEEAFLRMVNQANASDSSDNSDTSGEEENDVVPDKEENTNGEEAPTETGSGEDTLEENTTETTGSESETGSDGEGVGGEGSVDETVASEDVGTDGGGNDSGGESATGSSGESSVGGAEGGVSTP